MIGKREEECINDILTEIDVLDIKEEGCSLSITNKERKNSLKSNLAHRLHMEAISWKQKFGEKWLKDGDTNSKYFHTLAKHRRRVNYVEELIMDNNSIKGNETLRDGAKTHFQKLYYEDFKYWPTLGNLSFNSLNERERDQLEVKFTKEEIWGCDVSKERENDFFLKGESAKE